MLEHTTPSPVAAGLLFLPRCRRGGAYLEGTSLEAGGRAAEYKSGVERERREEAKKKTESGRDGEKAPKNATVRLFSLPQLFFGSLFSAFLALSLLSLSLPT